MPNNNRAVLRTFGVVLGLIVLACAILTLKPRTNQTPPLERASAELTPAPEARSVYSRSSARALAPPAEEPPASEEQPDDPIQVIPGIEEYLARHQHSAESLITAFQASKDTNYLRQAAERFPEDPRVQLRVISADLFPEAKREWLDRFKKAAPTNSLANYLSAREHFQNGDRASALIDLIDATAKPQFDDYTHAAMTNLEELHRSGGATDFAAKSFSLQAVELPQLAVLKNLSQHIRDFQGQNLQTDPDLATRITDLAVTLARRMNSPSDPGLIINQLVGIAMESMVLQPLNPDATYEFLGGTTARQRLDELKQQREGIRELTRDSGTRLAGLAADPAILNEYFERMRLYGEVAAIGWLKTRDPSP